MAHRCRERLCIRRFFVAATNSSLLHSVGLPEEIVHMRLGSNHQVTRCILCANPQVLRLRSFALWTPALDKMFTIDLSFRRTKMGTLGLRRLSVVVEILAMWIWRVRPSGDTGSPSSHLVACRNSHAVTKQK